MAFFTNNIKYEVDCLMSSYKGIKKFLFGSKIFRGAFSKVLRFVLNSKYLDSFLKDDVVDNLYANIFADLNISIDVSDEDLEKIPTDTPLIVIANHVSAPIDWMIISEVLAKKLKKKTYVATYSTSALLNDGTAMYVDQGRSFYKQCLEKLWNGHAIVIFPTGSVERIYTFDKHWKDSQEFKSGFLKIAQKAGAAILPMHVDLEAHPLRHVLSYIFWPLATLFGSREMTLHRNKKIKVLIGDAVPHSIVQNQSTNSAQMSEYKNMVYELKK